MPVSAAETPASKRILIIHSFNDDVLWQGLIWSGLEDGIHEGDSEVIVHREHLDAMRFPDLGGNGVFGSYLADKYHGIPLDLIVFDSVPASVFAGTIPDLFPGVERFHINGSPRVLNADPTAMESLVIRSDLTRSFNDMLEIATPKRVFVVGDLLPSPTLAHHVETVQKLAPALPPDIHVEIILGKTKLELIDALSELPEDSAMFFLPASDQSRGGEPVETYFGDITAAANAPGFTHWTPLFGTGVVGGYMISAEHIGRVAARRVRAALFGESPAADDPNGYVQWYDDRAMKRFGIDADELPPGSEVHFAPTSIIERFGQQILIFMGVVGSIALLATGWIAALRRQVAQRTVELDSQRRRAETLARTDVLTDLNNRRAFYELGEKIASDRRGDGMFSLIVADLDHFKRINDTFGHDAGDSVLREVAGRIRSTAREDDVSGRLGGEEFAIIAPATTPDNARRVAERLRIEIGETRLPDGTRVTVSLGVATREPADESLDSVMRRADEALYAAKEAGRNRVVCADRAAAPATTATAPTGLVPSLAAS